MIQWAPRLIMTDRLFRLPVETSTEPRLEAEGFEQVAVRFSPRDRAWMFYLRSPSISGDYQLHATDTAGNSSSTSIRVRPLSEMRQPFDDEGTCWPRRWPIGASWASQKKRQTLQDEPVTDVNAEQVAWWTAQDDASLWRHLPNAENPRAHYVNVHQGCPACGTEIFAHGGFYPWSRIHAPTDMRSTCPACAAVFPSNDLLSEDFTSGDFVDDGFGYFDDEGHVFLFAASSRRGDNHRPPRVDVLERFKLEPVVLEGFASRITHASASTVSDWARDFCWRLARIRPNSMEIS